MSMHLVGPWLSTSGKRKGKAKHRTADAANKARRNAEAWQALLEKYDVKPDTKTKRTVQPAARMDPVVRPGPVLDPKRSTRHIPSVDTGRGIAVKAPDKVYTGDAMLGVSVLHKSNGIPVFRQEDAVDIAKMRRG